MVNARAAAVGAGWITTGVAAGICVTSRPSWWVPVPAEGAPPAMVMKAPASGIPPVTARSPEEIAPVTSKSPDEPTCAVAAARGAPHPLQRAAPAGISIPQCQQVIRVLETLDYRGSRAVTEDAFVLSCAIMPDTLPKANTLIRGGQL